MRIAKLVIKTECHTGNIAFELVAEAGRVIAAVPRFAYLVGHPTRTAHECLLIEGYAVRKEPRRPGSDPCSES